MVRQGCRPEEVFGLKPSSLSFVDGTFKIEQGKSKAAKRTLLMHEETREILRRCRKGAWCFPSTDSASGHIESIHKAHKFVAEQIGCECVIYDWRHTFATRAAATMPGACAPRVACGRVHYERARVPFRGSRQDRQVTLGPDDRQDSQKARAACRPRSGPLRRPQFTCGNGHRGGAGGCVRAGDSETNWTRICRDVAQIHSRC
jgi:hypothetical protein